MSHRVIAGRAKGKRLKRVPGDSTRPIMDRAKEALFSILGTAIIDIRLLDLFAGTGAVGIEALSRGADWVTFLDVNRAAVATIHENLRTTKLAEQAEVLRQDAFEFLQRDDIDPYGLVYIAPPQYKKMWSKALLMLDEKPTLLEPDALVIVQIDPLEKENLDLKHLHVYDERVYGNTLLWFYEYEAPVEESHEQE
ncbi:MAG: 16S rRNA (guanine(966)-N(2))-methyltransferase RsmD [Anaerolineae bacterium]|nr:MAG: 16S rRNA (guanine(966)-N(2))-methyltransferase RsmD [Anaerolineae bacterium]MCL4877758.1 16S rRNA (guanine(966)-N(2))-methyltransferase RsmD [Anaerolineae bacterium]